MSSVLVLATLAAVLQQAPPPAAESPAVQLLAAAVNQIKTKNLDSAAVLLHGIVESPAGAVPVRVHAWVLLGVVDLYRHGDSAATFALRQALALDPAFEAAWLEPSYPDVAQLLAVERAALVQQPAASATPTAPPTSQFGRPPLHDCVKRCPEGVRPPQFAYFPELNAANLDADIDTRSRRLHTYLLFQAVISEDGLIEPESLLMMSGSARGTEMDLRQGLAQARFAPGRLNGAPVRTRVMVRFDFEGEGVSWVKYTYRVVSR